MSIPSYDLVVVGAGIVGAACAFEAARAGLTVAVVEATHPGGGATGAAMGHLVALDGSPAELALCRYSLALWRELAPSLPGSVHYREAGTIWLASSESDLVEARHKQARLEREGIPSTLLGPDELSKAEPALRPGLEGGLLVPGDGRLDPVAATEFLLGETVRFGGTIYAGQGATGIEEGTVLRGKQASLTAETVLIAAGVDSGRLLKEIPVRPRKGQLLRIEPMPLSLDHQLVELGYGASIRTSEAISVAFNVHPASDGSWTVGASREWGSTDTTTSPSTVERILRRAERFLPSLGHATVAKSWAGLRPAMPDHLPWIGPLPGRKGVWVATGHEGLGITCSLGTARLVVDGLLGRPSPVPRDPYLPDSTRAQWPNSPPAEER
ncbi:MAG: FAD-binding oxidoreductase [Thermoplasmata archaeon]|nr:FAD-binding oxidoreductase [Thermoplasmata archaeon]